MMSTTANGEDGGDGNTARDRRARQMQRTISRPDVASHVEVEESSGGLRVGDPVLESSLALRKLSEALGLYALPSLRFSPLSIAIPIPSLIKFLR
jgi:hypothetical protein